MISFYMQQQLLLFYCDGSWYPYDGCVLDQHKFMVVNFVVR